MAISAIVPNDGYGHNQKDTLESLSVHGFLTVALVDKKGRVRSVTLDTDFGNDEPLKRLIRRLVEE